MSKFQHWPLAVIVAFYLAAGGAFALTVTPWQTPDEPAHYNYIRQLVQQGQVPVIASGDYDGEFNMRRIAPPGARLGPEDAARLEAVQYEDHQPPLYYLLAAPVFALSAGSVAALRLLSVALGAFVIVFGYLAILEIFPGRIPLAAMAAALIGLLPQHVHMLAGINNDALAEALLAAAVWLTVRLIRQASPIPSELAGQNPAGGGPQPAAERGLLAVVVGLCFLTKTTAYYVFPVAALAVFAIAGGQKGLSRLLPVARFALVALLIGLPWWARNLAVYGGLDVMGLGRHDLVVVGQTTTAEWIAAHGWLSLADRDSYLFRGAQFTFQSWWGMFGWLSVSLPAWLYLALLAFTLVSAGLFLAWWWRKRNGLAQAQTQALMAMALLALITGLGFIWYNTKYVQHQGRYLFPALIPVALAMALGWQSALARWPRVARVSWLVFALALLILDGYALFRVVLPAMG